MPFSARTRRKCWDIRNRIYPKEDGASAFFRRTVLTLVSPEAIVVDVGCGREAEFVRSIASSFAVAYGIDIEIPEQITDGNLTLLPGDADAIPLGDASVDIVTSIHMIEHVSDPASILQECKRILKPGGSILLYAPSKWYPPLVLGRLLPHRLRQLVNRAITGTPLNDTFPTYYRANTKRALIRLAESLGLRPVRIEYRRSHPEHAMFSVLAYRAAVAVERALSRSKSLAFLRPLIFCHFQSEDTV